MEAYSYAVGVVSAAEGVYTCGQFWHECRLSDSTHALSKSLSKCMIGGVSNNVQCPVCGKDQPGRRHY
jgi:hypothetical protein